MKFSAVVLAPILLVLVGLHVMLKREWRGVAKHLAVMALAAGGVVFLVYAPYWAPAPPLPPQQAAWLGVPTWFRLLRPVLIPPGFFKGLALVAGHESTGHLSYLCGQWRQNGWWYYFPVAMAVKTPLPLLLLSAVGLGLWLSGCRRFSLPLAAPWLAALIYLMFAIVGTINIGIRHLLPMFALLAVGSASQFGLRSRPLQLCAWLGIGWLLVVTWRARPFFLEYFNEAAGGPSNGYQWLVDSNLDWGQDAKRLKRFLDEQAITNVDLACFGQARSIEYYGIPGRRTTFEKARETHNGTLIISANQLMRPEYDWLRACHEPVARIGYTMFVYHLGDPDTRDRWERMLRINPRDALAHYNLGIVLEQAGEPLAAIAHYEQAIQNQPDYPMAHYNLGIALVGQGRLAEAIGHFEKTVRLLPGLAGAHVNLGVALMKQGRPAEAIGHYEQALLINSGSAEAHYNLGVALAKLGRTQQAIAHYEQALRLKPDYAVAHYNLGNALLQMDRTSEAIAHYEQALRLQPDYAEAHYNLGIALEQAGRLPEAVNHYEQALWIKPDFVLAQKALARARAAQ
jgi:tetratricopeptide (TPR) repeat protein